MPFTSLRIYWRLVNNPTLQGENLSMKDNICSNKAKAFYLCQKEQIRMIEKKDINLLKKNTSNTITQRLWGNQKVLSKLQVQDFTRYDTEMSPENLVLKGEEFWNLLDNYIKFTRPTFSFTNIDFKLKTFTAEEKFPVQFWNTANAETKDKLLSSVESHWLLSQSYDKIDKTNFSTDLFLENVIKINNGKEKISCLFQSSKKEAAPKMRGSGHHFSLVSAFDDQEDYYETITDQRNLPMSMRYRRYRENPKKVRVGPSKIHCQGLFAVENFSQGDIVIEYVGEVINNQEADRREIYYEKSGMGDCYLFKLDKNRIIDASYKGNVARFLNHSCDANCNAKIESITGEKHILIFANRNISKGEELTYFYNFAVESDKIE